MNKRLGVVLATVILLASGGWAWKIADHRRQIVVANLPEAPDLTNTPKILQEKLAVAQARARAPLTASKGLVQIARLYHANGFLSEAAQCYAGLEKIDPHEPRWLHLHASILAGFGEIEPAAALWTEAVTLAPKYLPARIRLGDCRLKANQPDQAFAVYHDVLTQDPGNSYALLGLARLDLEAKKWDEARGLLETVYNQTNHELGYDLIVSLYERLGLREQAAEIRSSAKASGAYRDVPDPWLDDLVDDCYDPFRLALSAGMAARTGAPETAIKRLQQAIELSPQDVTLRFQLGGVYFAQQNFGASREQFETCTRIDPNFPDGWVQLSTLQTQAGDVSGAARTLSAGLANCPNSPGLHLMQARRLEAANQIGGAISEFRTSIRLRPNEPDAYVELANLYIKLGMESEGIALMRQALEADPGEPTALGALTIYAISLKNEAEATRCLTRANLQLRIPRQQISAFAGLYQQTFGHNWIPGERN